MKTLTLILSMLLFNAFLYGQKVDSFYLSEDYEINQIGRYNDGSEKKKDTVYLYSFCIENYKPDTIKLKPEIESLFDSVTIFMDEEPVYHRKRDTIPVLLLLSNIKNNYHINLEFNVAPNGKVESKEDTINIGYDYSVYWRHGFSIKELHSTAEEFDAGMTPKELWGTWWENVSYLDENKNELPKNIIIWQSKEINPHN